MATGRPCRATNASTSSTPLTGPSVPGASGAPTSCAIRRAATLSPSASMAAGGGPIQVSPASMTARAKAAFSARNPYPGCTASAPASAARLRIFSMLR
jgi:hypothetical protein